MAKIPKALIEAYNDASTWVYGKVPLGSPGWIDPKSYVEDEDESVNVASYSVFLNHTSSDDPYHEDTLDVNVSVERMFSEDEPTEGESESDEYTIHEETLVSDLSHDELKGLIEQIVKGACER